MATDNPLPHTPTSFLDWRGNEVKIGDLVLYPRMSGRSCEVKEGKLAKIATKTYPIYERDPETRVNKKVGEEERISSVGIFTMSSSRRFYGSKGNIVTVTVVGNVTFLDHAEDVAVEVVPTLVSYQNLEEHLKGHHGKGKNVTALRGKHKIKRVEKYSNHYSLEDQEKWNAALITFHNELHEADDVLVSHKHDPDVFGHHWLGESVTTTRPGQVWDTTLEAIPQQRNAYYSSYSYGRFEGETWENKVVFRDGKIWGRLVAGEVETTNRRYTCTYCGKTHDWWVVASDVNCLRESNV